MLIPPLPPADLELIVDRARDDLRIFDGSTLLLTGGTGFVGSWLLESVLAASRRLAVNINLVVLSRDPETFLDARPHLHAVPGLVFLRGDVRTADAGDLTPDAVIHAATPARASFNVQQPDEMLDVIERGTERMIALAQRAGQIPFLFTSSGAVYGKQPPGVTHVDETYSGAPDPMNPVNAYHEGKRVAELRGSIAALSGLGFVSARLFAFLGPLLPLDEHFAAGNFIRDALAGDEISVAGDGTAVRSYLYPTDLAVWLWALLARGQRGAAYNVGSERSVSIAELAELCGRLGGGVPVRIKGQVGPGALVDRYVPSTARIRQDLGVVEDQTLETAIEETLRWWRDQ